MEALTFEDFSFSYPHAAVPVLRGVDWRVPQGAFVLLVGATGSGKSTLLRCAKPETAPVGERSGSVSTCGASVGYVAQSPENQVVCDTVWHELAFGLENEGMSPDAMRRRVAEVACFFGIEPWFGEETARLSGGQKQLLNLASVLAMRPGLLLLDEPTGQLDPVAAKNFLHAIFRVNRECGITVVVATHAPESMAAYATAAVRLENGRILPVDVEEFRRPLAPETGEGGGFEAGVQGDRTEIAPGNAEASSGEGAEQAAVEDSDARSETDACPRKEAAPARALGANPAVEAHEVFFRYARELPWVLAGASLSVEPGTVHAVVGGNGSGKSTLLRLAAGVLSAERGRVRNALSDSQALVPQDPRALFACDSVREELLEWSAPAHYDVDDACAMARRFGLEGLADRHPSDLSGGQQQLLAEAKVLLVRPRLLLLDEPSKGLDAASKLVLAQAIDEERLRGTTVLMVSHDLAFVSCLADAVTMLFDGEDACTEPTADFFEGNLFFLPEPDAFARLWRGRSACVERGGSECPRDARGSVR